jgi:hypothetical protein
MDDKLSIGLMRSIPNLLKKDPMFIQALKDFQTMGFIEIKENGIEIIDRKGLENYLNNFGKFESDTKH